MMEWHQLDHMQIICTLLQTDNYTSTSPLSFNRLIKSWHNLVGQVTGGFHFQHGFLPHNTMLVRYMVYRVFVCPYVCLSVTSRCSVLKWLKVGWCKQCCTN